MMLSKFITANSLDDIAAPEMSARATTRSSEAVLDTAVGEKPEESG
jgi:hypothetical protein